MINLFWEELIEFYLFLFLYRYDVSSCLVVVTLKQTREQYHNVNVDSNLLQNI